MKIFRNDNLIFKFTISKIIHWLSHFKRSNPMKKFRIFYSLLLFFITFHAHSQTVSFKNGGLLYEDKVVRKPNEVLSIIQSRSTPEMMKAFAKYESNRSVSSVLATIGGGLSGYYLGRSLRKDSEVSTGILYGGLGTVLVSFIISTQSNKALKEIIGLYNRTEPPRVSIAPLIRIDNTSNEVGIAVRF